jgi:TM2 domain-containing membrane protein YozV
MAAAFGRKGLTGTAPSQGINPGQFQASPRTGTARAVEPAPHDPYAEQRAAVIAAFRAETAEASRAAGQLPPRAAPLPEPQRESRQPVYHGDVVAAYSTPYQDVVKPKSMVAAYLFWLFFGGFSAHRFYLGRTQSAWTQFGLFALGWVVLLTSLPRHQPVGISFGILLLFAHGFWLIGDAFLIPGIVRASRRPDYATSFH